MKVFSISWFIFSVFLFEDVLCRNHRLQVMTKDDKIVGGYETNIEKFPYQALLTVENDEGSFLCGGSILDANTVLTAAHCLFKMNKVQVKTGSTKASSGGTISVASNFAHHPEYNDDTLDYDVGIVKLLSPIKIDGRKTKAVRISKKNSNITIGAKVIVSGWGVTSEKGAASENLRAVEVRTVSNDECRQSYNKSLTERMFCAGVPQGGKDACQGDSGGPVVSKQSRIQIGVVSYGKGCGRKKYPGVYTRLANSDIRDWIKAVSGI